MTGTHSHSHHNHHHHRASASTRASSAYAASRAGKTDVAVKTHQAVSNLFAKRKAEEYLGRTAVSSGRAWSNKNEGGAKSSLAAHYTEEQIAKMIAEGVPQGDSPTKRVHYKEGASCFVINAMRHLHKYERPEGSTEALQNERYSYSEQLRNYNRQMSIIRHERTIPDRRVLDRYVNITSAQEGLARIVPTHESVARRHSEGWALNNEHRQQMSHGAPVMTRVMHGEYYYPEVKRTKPASYIAANIKNVRDASRVSTVANHHAHTSALPRPADAPQPKYAVDSLRMPQRSRSASCY